MSIAGLLANIGLGLLYFMSFGLLMKVGFQRQFGLTINPSELLTLPLMMNLFTYIIPIKGGLLFQIFYMKRRHHLDISGGFSLGVTLFVTGLLITVVVGLALNGWLGLGTGPIFYFLALIGVALVLFAVVLGMLPVTRTQNGSISGRLLQFLCEVGVQLRHQLSHPRLLRALFACSLLSLLVQTVWYWQAGVVLGVESHFLSMLLVTLVLRVVLLVRILPGNLGFQELVMGAVFAAAGFSVQDGLLIALLTRFVSVLLTGTIGLAGFYASLGRLDVVTRQPLIDLISEPQAK